MYKISDRGKQGNLLARWLRGDLKHAQPDSPVKPGAAQQPALQRAQEVEQVLYLLLAEIVEVVDHLVGL